MGKLAGKIALVTGASRGIGRAIAMRLANDGAEIAVHYARNQEVADKVVQDINREGGAAFAIQADLQTVQGVYDCYAAMDGALLRMNRANKFDILVNNAGISQMLSIEETTESSIDEVLNLHVKSPLFMIQQALPRMRDGGRIINLSSAVTRISMPNLLGYSVSKGAVNTLTQVLAQHLGGRNITVNAILPGIIETEMNEATLGDPAGRQFALGLSALGRWGQPEDVAAIAAFLASADSRWVTGQLIDASGGSRL